MRYMKPEPFLDFLEEAMSSRTNGDEIFAGLRGPFELTRQFDLVLIGPCSTDGWLMGRKPSAEYPLGKYASGESCLHFIMRDSSAKTVLLISGCCGAYSDEHSELIRASHPEVEFVIPDVPDFCDNLFVHGRKDHVATLIENLRTQGLMR